MIQNIKNKFGAIDTDQLGYIILGVIALIILIGIVIYIFGTPMEDAGDKIGSAFDVLG